MSIKWGLGCIIETCLNHKIWIPVTHKLNTVENKFTKMVIKTNFTAPEKEKGYENTQCTTDTKHQHILPHLGCQWE